MRWRRDVCAGQLDGLGHVLQIMRHGHAVAHACACGTADCTPGTGLVCDAAQNQCDTVPNHSPCTLRYPCKLRSMSTYL